MTKKISIPEFKTEDNLSLKLKTPRIRVKIIGLGGGGVSIVSELSRNLKGIEFLAANTDSRSLKKAAEDCKTFAFGHNITRGMGTGMDPQLAERAAQDSKDRILALFKNVDLAIFIVCLGGGTGSGAMSVFAEAARKAGCLNIGIFTTPFYFEGEKKTAIAKETILKTEPYFHGVFLLGNEKIFSIMDKNTPLHKALSEINAILIRSLGDLINVLKSPGLINIDFSDLKTVLQGPGRQAFLASESAEGQSREETALKLLFEQPLALNKLSKPKRILLNISGGKDLKISEVEKIATALYKLNPASRIILGIQQGSVFGKKVKITLLALGGQEIVLKEFTGTEEIQAKERGIQAKKNLKAVNKNRPGKKIFQESRIAKPIKTRKSNIRKTALDLKKETRKLEKEFIKEEQKWDEPAFLKNKKWKINLLERR